MSRHQRLAEALGVPWAQVDALRDWYDSLDRRLQDTVQGLDLPCQAGCSQCCYEAVFVSAPEFLLVAAEVLDWSPDRRLRLIEAMRSLAWSFRDELELLEELPVGPERDEVAARVRFRCPLLGRDETCAVYPVRELNARTFGQAWDGMRAHPYGCDKTHASLRVVPNADQRLLDARALRYEMADRLGTAEGSVHVYPWWFERYAGHFVEL